MIESPSLSSNLASVGEAVGALAASSLAGLDGADATAALGELTTLIGRLDGLRVRLARQVMDRELYRATGARSLAAWLRGDPRVADDAWKIARLAAMAPALPRVTELLEDGRASLAQAGAACWQIAGLPGAPVKPPAEQAEPADGAGDGWAGLWMAGDLTAAADELLAGFLPRLDAQGLRAMGAHLREAADPAGRSRDDRSDYLSRAFRISPSLGSCGEISGRLHPEAAAHLIATFTELGAKSGPDDDRTKAQRWADALLSLAVGASSRPLPAAAGEPDDDQPGHDHGHGDHGADGQHEQQPAEPGRLRAGLRRPRVIVITPLDTLLRGPLAPGAVLGAGIPLPAEAARRISCDAELIRFVTAPHSAPRPAGGQVATEQLKNMLAAAIAGLPPPLGGPSAALDIGRKSQGWTPRQRDAIYALFGGRCGWPGGCDGPIDVLHHLVHWADGGLTSVHNGWPGCLYHHWLVHEGGWRLKKLPDGIVTAIPPPPGWKPGTIYRHGRPVSGQQPAQLPDQSAA